MTEHRHADVDALARRAAERHLTVGAAESLTGGSLSARLAAGPGSAEWYRGGIVSYSSEVKFDLLDVPRGPVVSEVAATAMARNAGRLLGSDLTIAVTGAGGPDPQDGQPPGTVWMALHDRRSGETRTAQHRIDGDPAEVVDETCRIALAWLVQWSDG